MNISILLPHVRPYGGILRMLNIANMARAMGHDVTIYQSGSAEFFKSVHKHLVYVFPEQYDEVHRARFKHLYYYNLNLYHKALLRIPTPIAFFLRRIFAINRAYWIRRALLDSRANILVNCTDSALWIEKCFRIHATPILGAVDHALFHPLAVSKNHNKILCLGSPKYWKGTEIIKKAVAIVQKTYPQMILEAFDGTPQDQLPHVYAEASIFVDAQIYAGWNNPVAEAMACNIPVVCYDIGPNRDIATNEHTALLVPPKRPDLMAEAIIRLMRDAVLRDTLIRNASVCIQKFTWERTTSEFLNVLEHAQS